jgi:hypothetical protein
MLVARTRLELLMKFMSFLHFLDGNDGPFTGNTIEFGFGQV